MVQRSDGLGGIEPGTAYPVSDDDRHHGGLDGLGLADVDGNGDLDAVLTMDQVKHVMSHNGKLATPAVLPGVLGVGFLTERRS